VFEPGRQRQDWRARVVVGLDTSSSIDALTLEMFAAEVDGIAARSGAEVHLLGFDEAVHHEERLRAGLRGAVQGLTLRSGGGTDYRPVIAHAARLAPSALILLTDLDGPTGPPPPWPVIWAGPEGKCPEPPFGTLVEISC
jgi:predicted metal-dependent peptidase